MNDQLIPKGMAEIEPVWKNFFENKATVQFDHRMLAYATVCLSWALLFTVFRARVGGPLTTSALLACVMVNYQALSGILTLVNLVPRQKANVHQMTAVLTFTSVLLMVFLTKRPPRIPK